MKLSIQKGLAIAVVVLFAAFSGGRINAQQPKLGDQSIIDDSAISAPIENGGTVLTPIGANVTSVDDQAVAAPDEVVVDEVFTADSGYMRGWFEGCIEFAPIQKCVDRLAEIQPKGPPAASIWWLSTPK